MEADALARFYASAGGAHWLRSDGWLHGPPCNGSINHWWGLDCLGGHVTELLMYNNHLTGTLATELGQLASLTQIWLPTPDPDPGGNSLSGTLPTQLGRPRSLTDLVLNGNSLSGTLPRQLGRLSNASSFTLDTNYLSGTVPTSVGRLAALNYLGFDRNRISGTLPTQLGLLARLEWLNLDSNLAISGTLPRQLAGLSSLLWLDLFKNALSGTLAPELFSALPLQTDLRIHANRLSGTLPSQLGALHPSYCYLTNEQCVEDTGGDARFCGPKTTNRFACPLPARLNASAACGGRGLSCTHPPYSTQSEAAGARSNGEVVVATA